MTSTPERQLRAYYHEFQPTGDDKVDAILEAVAMAGKAFHHTGQWSDEERFGLSGYWGLIQQRANEAAIVQGEPEWRPLDTAPQTPEALIRVQQIATFRWLPYKEASDQRRRGLMGRWQRHNGNGFENEALTGFGWQPVPLGQFA